MRKGSGLGMSEAIGNFEESYVNWGHVGYRCQNAEDEDNREGMKIMNFDREKDYREYVKDEGRERILVSFSGYWQTVEQWVGWESGAYRGSSGKY